MKPTLLVVLGVALYLTLLHGCAHVPPATVTCVADATLIPEVIDDLRADDYATRIEQLVIQRGLCIVDATVGSLLGPRAAADPIVAAHARAWLASHPYSAALDGRLWRVLNGARAARRSARASC